MLARTPPNTDVLFLGDINARVGKAENKVEEGIIGIYGEKNAKRNLGGKLAIEFLQERNLTCINAIRHRTLFTADPRKIHSLISLPCQEPCIAKNMRHNL